MAIITGQMFGDKEGLIITTFAILGGSLNSPSWQVVYLYTAELFPTVVRWYLLFIASP